jgi:hypothetical protein
MIRQGAQSRNAAIPRHCCSYCYSRMMQLHTIVAGFPVHIHTPSVVNIYLSLRTTTRTKPKLGPGMEFCRFKTFLTFRRTGVTVTAWKSSQVGPGKRFSKEFCFGQQASQRKRAVGVFCRYRDHSLKDQQERGSLRGSQRKTSFQSWNRTRHVSANSPQTKTEKLAERIKRRFEK